MRWILKIKQETSKVPPTGRALTMLDKALSPQAKVTVLQGVGAKVKKQGCVSLGLAVHRKKKAL